MRAIVVKPESERRQSKIELRSGMHVHVVGIGGSGMSAIARVLLGRGYTVSGSDLQANRLTDELAAAGASIRVGHSAENLADADLLLVSSAVPADNPEVMAAVESHLPVLKRAEFLGTLMENSHGIAVAGSHGKTTTTGMIAQILMEADEDPSVVVGGVLPLLNGNGRAGQGRYFLVEADEYDYMFLGLRPQTAVVTNIEYDHPDLFTTESEYAAAFEEFVRLLPPVGRLVICGDDPGAAALKATDGLVAAQVETYGLGSADWQALELRQNQLGGTDFVVQSDQGLAGLARIRIPGEHNVRNALAAIAVTSGLGIDFNLIRQALAAFGGASRRFQVIGEAGDVTVIDDYAHHPTEIKATLAAARLCYPGRRIWAVWQPHTFSRTKRLLAQFATSFGDADRVVALDIYRSRETDTLGIDTSVVLQAMEHANAHYIGTKDEAAEFILERLRPGDVIITLTAGDGNLVGESIMERLKKRIENGSAANGRGHS